MADNGKASTDPTIAWDDIGGNIFQRIKIALGKDGENVGDLGGALRDTDKTAAFVIPRPDIRIAQPTVTVTASSAYTAGNLVGGLLTIANAVAVAGNAIRLSSIIVTTTAASADLRAWVFRDLPSGTYTDKTALTVDAADIVKPVLFGHSMSSATDGTNTWFYLGTSEADFLPEFTLVGTSLYVLLSTGGTPTFAATSSVKPTIVYERL